ncbi:MAG: hypothetical protein NVV73_07835 [Cellvibrionaceae bacterium]|nr:hypothetical protein [Cellvibrionaceae bacterium]
MDNEPNMPNFIPYDLNQSEMIVINYLDQLSRERLSMPYIT